MKHEEIIGALGGISAVAKQIAVAPHVVRKWVNRKHIPAEHWPRLTAAFPDKVSLSELALSQRGRHRSAPAPAPSPQEAA